MKKYGGMHGMLEYNIPDTKIAILWRKHMLCWASLSNLNYEGDNNPELNCYTNENYRRQGYAGETIRALSNYLGITNVQQVNVYAEELAAVVESIGYTPNYLNYDLNHWYQWLQVKFPHRKGMRKK